MSLNFIPVLVAEQQEKLAVMADEIWHEYWPRLIGAAQTDYMVERFQSPDAIKRDMAEHGYLYWFMEDANDAQGESPGSSRIMGYTGGRVEEETHRFFISKIYLYKHERGRGYARETVEFYDALCRERGLCAMYLTVNKGNELGVRAYLGTGFQIVDSVETPIGEGFIMDDYIMERPVG